jgi:plasmid stabilization system protein ParE
MKLEFHPEAEQEFLQSVLRYEAEVPGLGERFHAELHAAAAVLLDYPQLGVPIDPDLRKLVLERFPYSVIYSLTPDTIYILAVANEKRPPRYWHERG